MNALFFATCSSAQSYARVQTCFSSLRLHVALQNRVFEKQEHVASKGVLVACRFRVFLYLCTFDSMCGLVFMYMQEYAMQRP